MSTILRIILISSILFVWAALFFMSIYNSLGTRLLPFLCVYATILSVVAFIILY